jgi:FKBP-type peptidyl-prolyl cis-trans isomerase (trigger factor)
MHTEKTIGENAEIIITGTLPKEVVASFWERALQETQKTLAVPGFRKGHVPEDRVIQEVGADFLWRECAYMALREELDEIMKTHEVSPIAPLSISMPETKKDTEVAFSVTAVTPPTCTIPEYKEVAEKALAALPAEDFAQEKETAVRAFRMQLRAMTMLKTPEAVQEGDAKKNEDDANNAFSDEEAKSAGFENSAALEHFIDGEAEKAVTDRAIQKKRGAIAEALIGNAVVSIPTVLIDDETRSLLDMFKQDVVRQGLTWDDYLARIKKNEGDVSADLAVQAKKRITLDLVFAEIIAQEKITREAIDKEKVDAVAQALIAQSVPHERAHHWAQEQLLREKVWEVLGVASENAV